jgi:hypothetical protein
LEPRHRRAVDQRAGIFTRHARPLLDITVIGRLLCDETNHA